MIHAELYKIDSGGYYCNNGDCSHNLKYHSHLIGNNFVIKVDVTCVMIYLGTERELYCPDCIDVVYKKLKPVLNTKLWALK